MGKKGLGGLSPEKFRKWEYSLTLPGFSGSYSWGEKESTHLFSFRRSIQTIPFWGERK
jgi:hypothetical protein